MNILILQGPNLNLLGLQSSKSGHQLTLDKVNRAIRHHVRNKDIELKILQTHKLEKAVTLLQRNRNWADGILIAPMSWARYEYVLKEVLELIEIPFIEIHFDNDFYMGTSAEDSILSSIRSGVVSGKPDDVFVEGLDLLVNQLSHSG